MTATYQTLLSDAFLRAIFDKEFQKFKDSPDELALIAQLEKWAAKDFQKETSAETAFINVFFEDIWGYVQSGKTHAKEGFTCYPKLAVTGAGATGGVGAPDAALGVFGRKGLPPTPQAMCEFKDVRSNLDGPQKRKGNNRSPVKQCADYLREAMKPMFGNEAILPTWGIVTDMNEFRLYWRSTMPSQFQRFVIAKATTDEGTSLLEQSEAGSFQRFLFKKLFHAETLLSEGGPSPLLRLLKDQRYQEKQIEKEFYLEYRAYRVRLVDLIIEHNPTFPGTKGRLVRLAQKLIDRCIFVMFCEDMGEQLSFPPNALRDYLSELSKSATFEEDEQDAWNKLKELFHAMNEGKKFRSHPINKFNGGMFAADAELDAITIPNSAFCAKLQGENDTSLAAHPLTLLYFAGSYNFGTVNRDGRAITLYTLGRIFEQSITELEALEAEKEKRESLTVISKRKRDGVYYTPEWVVNRIVAETLGPRLDDIRLDCGWSFDLEGDEEAIAKQLSKSPSDRSETFKRHLAAITKFRGCLEDFTVLDPACGSGAFLISTLEYLLRERRRVQRELALMTGGKREGLFEFKPDDEIRQILSKNIFGVDINAASVEIARLALWLHTAKSDQPLSNLDTNIVEGNSLVGSDVYAFRKELFSATESKKETINAFDYEVRFPSVFDKKRPRGPGFDCVVGNPPYVKLQNFKKVYPETADYLRNATGKGGVPRYASCQTGNFDLYLPFIERGLELLNTNGRLGYIAPSVWRYNEYGAGLRKVLHAGGHLDRWIDFGSFQVFDEALIYTALQFYSKNKNDRVKFALAPSGEVARIHDWTDPDWYLTYKELPKEDTWIFVSRTDRAVIDKLSKSCRRLDDKAICRHIFQGLITSADPIYHLDRIGKDTYQYYPPKPERAKVKPPAETVQIEDSIMHPLVSGQEANRYENPTTDTYILFPYSVVGEVSLFTQSQLKKTYPMAWKHLKRFEKALKARESGAFDDDTWWRFGRHQNIDKQEDRKLIVAQTVKHLSVCPDEKGKFYLNNVRVNGIIATRSSDFWFILGLLNSNVADWVFRRIAKPKEGGYFEANRQFIAPLPIPFADAEQIKAVTNAAKELSRLHSERREVLRDLDRRFASCDVEEYAEEDLWPTRVTSLEEMKSKAPAKLSNREKAAWAKDARQKEIETVVTELADSLVEGAKLSAQFAKGELRLYVNEAVIIDGIFLDDDDGRQTLLDWRHFLRTTPITEATDAERFARELRTVRSTNNKALAKQLEALDTKIETLDSEIADLEAETNKLVCALYKLSATEVKLVQAG